ncbi:hypothetical protein [Marisediminicola antarctica]|uniref:hypothetical protein n=1 Tax=Marisediminicola antarctica TaxID=674079 RepID=UPI0013794046|nr:hypothetical protein [Marisediminicola antarctica]
MCSSIRVSDSVQASLIASGASEVCASISTRAIASSSSMNTDAAKPTTSRWWP